MNGSGAARATNEATGTITVTGDGSDGVDAVVTGSVSAVATNRGVVKAEGDTWIDTSNNRWSSSSGVHAWSFEGTARAVNEEGATITTGKQASDGTRSGGRRTRGLSAGNGDDGSAGGRAEAVNRGTIITYGEPLDPNSLVSSGSRGAQAFSESGSAYAENSGTITTWGKLAHGLYANAEKGSGNQSARAVNSGMITAKGDGDVEADRRNYGVLAYTAGGAEAEAVNTPGGVILAEGDGTRGLGVYAGSPGSGSSGVAIATNRGMITTTGDRLENNDNWLGSHGMWARSEDSTATATNEAGGTVRTEGIAATGVSASSGSGAAMAVNAGDVRTEGGEDSTVRGPDATFAAHGVWARSDSGNATAINQASGEILTTGTRAFGMAAWIENDGSRTSATAEFRNHGEIRTEGANADAGVAFATEGGTAANPNRVRAYNEAGATITTSGDDGSGGMSATIRIDASSAVPNAYGDAMVRNDGTITTTGGRGSRGGLDNAYGIGAVFLADGSEAIGNAGDAAARNTGTITVSGVGARGVQAATFGTGTVTVEVDGGTGGAGGRITASHDDTSDDSNDGVGIYAGILGSNASSGRINAGIANGAVVTAQQAALFEGAPATVNLSNAAELVGRVSFGDLNDRFNVNAGIVRGVIDLGGGSNTLSVRGGGYLDGAITFGDGDDTLTVENGGYFGGAIDFGGGTDTLTVAAGPGAYFNGAITGLTDFTGSGGTIRLDDVTFSGSSAEFMGDSTVHLTGDFDLGSDGTMTIREGARVIAFASKDASDMLVLPTITAGMGIQCGTCQFQVQNEDADATLRDFVEGQGTDPGLFASGTELFASGTTSAEAQYVTVGADGQERSVDLENNGDDELPQATPLATPDEPKFVDPTPPGQPPGSRGGGGGAVIAAGGLLVLLLSLFDFDMEALAWNEELQPAYAEVAYADTRHWVRNLSGTLSPAGSASGVEIGLETGVGDGFFLGLGATPDMTTRHGDGDAAASGGRYSLSGGWRDESMFVGLKFTRADWEAETAFENPVAGGGLSGAFGAVQNDLRLGTGVRLALGGGFSLTPKAEVFAGDLERDGHTAVGAAFRADMPGVTQRYRGWKAGLGLTSGWLKAGSDMKVRPALGFSAMRVETESNGFMMKQSDRLGMIGTATRARLAGAPETVFGLTTGVQAESRDGMRLRFGYAGLMSEGKLDHAIVGGLQLRF